MLRLPEPALTRAASLCCFPSLSLSPQLLEDEVVKNKESDEAPAPARKHRRKCRQRGQQALAGYPGGSAEK